MNRINRDMLKLNEIKIEVTHRCKLSCIHCSSDASPSNVLKMDYGDCERIINEAAAMGVKEVTFSGGEPLIWNGLEQAIATACRSGFEVTIYTSGNAEEVARKLESFKKFGVRRCIFSIFGSSVESHKQVTRVPESFQKTAEAIRIANNVDLRTELHFVPMSSNYRELEKIAVWGKGVGVACISVLRFVPQGRGKLLKRRVLDRLQNLELKRTIEKLRNNGFEIRTGSPYNFLMLNNKPKCFSGQDRLLIGPDMRVYPCDAFKKIRAEDLVGSLKGSSLEDTSLEDCWNNSPFLEAVRKYLKTPFPVSCSTCKKFVKCKSGCLAQKVVKYGNLNKRHDPDCLLVRNG